MFCRWQVAAVGRKECPLQCKPPSSPTPTYTHKLEVPSSQACSRCPHPASVPVTGMITQYQQRERALKRKKKRQSRESHQQPRSPSSGKRIRVRYQRHSLRPQEKLRRGYSTMTMEPLSGYALRLVLVSTALTPGIQGPCSGFGD